ncbi:MAG: RHS repeat-associated core domain-containing protein, partial [bacterium]|nr:RHS repeat-associated core domain-containing protein [bacterium]
HHPATGLYYFGARWYDPQVGRFITKDPAFNLNPYPYCYNNPVNLIDPTGEWVDIFLTLWDWLTKGEKEAAAKMSLQIAHAQRYLQLVTPPPPRDPKQRWYYFTIAIEFYAEKACLKENTLKDLQNVWFVYKYDPSDEDEIWVWNPKKKKWQRPVLPK